MCFALSRACCWLAEMTVFGSLGVELLCLLQAQSVRLKAMSNIEKAEGVVMLFSALPCWPMLLW